MPGTQPVPITTDLQPRSTRDKVAKVMDQIARTGVATDQERTLYAEVLHLRAELEQARPVTDASATVGLLDWLLSMDDPENVNGAIARVSVSLTEIIERAREVRALLGATPEADRRHVAADDPGILWMAMRYALGRSTYAAAEVCDAISKHAGELTSWQRERMAVEIEQAGALKGHGSALAAIDVPYWTRAVAALRATTPTAQEDPT